MTNLIDMERELAALQEKVTAERARVKAATIEAIQAMLESGTLTFDDLRVLLPDATPPKRDYRKKPVYRDPATGNTWTGQGQAPKWIRDAANREDFLIKGQS